MSSKTARSSADSWAELNRLQNLRGKLEDELAEKLDPEKRAKLEKQLAETRAAIRLVR